jgi:hypothetical protein
VIHVLLSNGDSAEAETVEEAIFAARTIWDDADRNGTHTQRRHVSFQDAEGNDLVPLVMQRVRLGPPAKG